MNDPFLLGPINQGAAFMIVSIQAGIPYILNQTTSEYYWDPIIPLDPLVFSATGTSTEITITDTINGGGIGVGSDAPRLVPTATPIPLQVIESNFAAWASPALFLSMVEYTILSPNGTPTTVGSTPANNIIILPVVWYYDQPGGCVATNINTPTTSVKTWFCNVRGNEGCITNAGWTQLNDCNNGIRYTYCPPEHTCGTQNCNGPCPTTATTCTLQDNNYVCVGITELWTEPWFLTLIIVLGVLAIALFAAAATYASMTNASY